MTARVELDTFTRAYLVAALWTEDPDPGSGEYAPHDDWTIENMAPEALEHAREDCARFQTEHWARFAGHEEQAGHDFWLTRNRHGAGFWDRPEVYGEAAAKYLSEAARKAGEVELYQGDDRRLYFSR